MKVKCVKFYNQVTMQYQDSSVRLTKGKEYVVLEIEIYPERDILYRLVGDNSDKSPGLYDSRQFEVVSGKLPSSWVIHQVEGKQFLCIGPKSWQELSFWEDCYDGDPKALEIYKREARIIYEEEGML